MFSPSRPNITGILAPPAATTSTQVACFWCLLPHPCAVGPRLGGAAGVSPSWTVSPVCTVLAMPCLLPAPVALVFTSSSTLPFSKDLRLLHNARFPMRVEKPSEVTVAESALAASRSCISVLSLIEVVGSETGGCHAGDGGSSDTARTVFGARGVGDDVPDDVCFRFSVCCWQGGAVAVFGSVSLQEVAGR
ncbi:hypothetical protein FPQ18DRAFT_329391 [Pyronema domesticum]|nr:hypothetical protein FPQ18DRAFT_329391 [Pyronema domesticum]